MPITRAKASSLLNQKEMALYDDSRINGLRQLDAKGLASRIKRARTARDRARDLVQKHKLASRASTGSKRGSSGQANQRSKDKAGLMADILKRFEGRLKEVERAEKAATAKGAKKAAPAKTAKAAKKEDTRTGGHKTSTRKGTTKATRKAASKTSKPAKKASKSATKRTTRERESTQRAASAAPARKRAGAGETARRAKTAGQAATGATPAKRAAAAKSTRERAGKATRKRRITPEQALAQTQALLEAKQAQDAAPKPWQDAPGGGVSADGQPGYQSGAAKRRALRLHQAEARIPAIQGSVSTRDRINQGKRDHRGGDNGD